MFYFVCCVAAEFKGREPYYLLVYLDIIESSYNKKINISLLERIVYKFKKKILKIFILFVH